MTTVKTIKDIKIECNKNYEEFGYKLEVFDDSEIIDMLNKLGYKKTLTKIKNTFTAIDNW